MGGYYIWQQIAAVSISLQIFLALKLLALIPTVPPTLPFGMCLGNLALASVRTATTRQQQQQQQQKQQQQSPQPTVQTVQIVPTVPQRCLQ
jgi:flagellar biosynthesis component FlhA